MRKGKSSFPFSQKSSLFSLLQEGCSQPFLYNIIKAPAPAPAPRGAEAGQPSKLKQTNLSDNFKETLVHA